tara:strand:- start:57 stop:470 length:414 start_codon:yes stop_codon:yes gene_type:complete
MVWKDIPEVHCFDDEVGDPEFNTAFNPRYDREICEIINDTFIDQPLNDISGLKYAHRSTDINITRRFTACIAKIGFSFRISNPVEEEVEEFLKKIHLSTYWCKLYKRKRRDKTLHVYLIKNDANINEDYLRETGWFY